MRLKHAFGAIVVGLSACEDLTEVPPKDSGLDATVGDEADVTVDDGGTDTPTADAIADVSVDTYVDWCEAGPPNVLGGDTCYHYVYVPCGIPPEDTIDDAGNVNYCNPICLGFTDDLCAVLPPPWPAVIMDAGLIEAGALADGGVFVLCACTGSAGRAPEGLERACVRARSALGVYFGHGAHREAASVIAFARIHRELRTLGAPRVLLAEVRRARRDETRHARVVGALARRFGASTARPRVRRFRKRSAEALATENAIEGCAREAFGALVATWQAHHAGDVHIRRAMERIACDETRHAELSYAIASFLAAKLDDDARRRVEDAWRDALANVAASYAPTPELAFFAGLPSSRIAARLAQSLTKLVADSRGLA